MNSALLLPGSSRERDRGHKLYEKEKKKIEYWFSKTAFCDAVALFMAPSELSMFEKS